MSTAKEMSYFNKCFQTIPYSMRNMKGCIINEMKDFPGVAVIFYEFRQGGQLADNWMWTMLIDGELEDYDKKEQLIKQCDTVNREWVVLKKHKDGSTSIVNQSAENIYIINKYPSK